MPAPFAIDLVAFIGFGVAASVVASRYVHRLASTTGAVASNEELLGTFQRDAKGMPRANIVETEGRLRALFTRQQDPQSERLRRVALALYGGTLLAFFAFPFVPGFN